MSAGFKYNLTPEPSIEERYDVSTGIRRRGAYKLNTANLSGYLPSFTPIAANLKTKVCEVVRNVLVIETTAAEATLIKIAKKSLAYVGMTLGTSEKGAKITSIDKTKAEFDALTLDAAIGAVEKGSVLFEAKDADGKEPKNVANSALYERKPIEEGINIIALLSAAREIEPDKLELPFSIKDKEALGCDFQFNE